MPARRDHGSASRQPAPADQPDHADQAATDELVTALLTASRALVGVSARSLAGVEDTVTLSQFRTLVVLEAHGASRLNTLAGRLHVNASTAQRAIDRLVTAGLVDRRENPDDRRQVVLELTGAGRSLVTEVTERRRAAIGEVVAAMAPGRRRGLVAALLDFAAAADEPPALGETATSLGW